MDGEDEFRIKAVVDSTEATAGTDAMASGIEKVKGATKEAGTSFDGFNDNVLRSRYEITHLARGLVELSEGGTNALAGLGSEMYVLGEAFEEVLGPAAPVFIGLGLLASVGVPMLEHFWQTGARESADAKATLSDYTQAWKDAAAEIEDVLGQIRQAQEAVRQEDVDDLNVIKEKRAFLNKEAGLQKEEAIQKLQREYIAKESAPGVSPKERERLKKEFEAAKKDIEESSQVNVAANAVDEANDAKVSADSTVTTDKEAVAANQKMLDDDTALHEEAHSYLEALGFTKGGGPDGPGPVDLDAAGKGELALQGQIEKAKGLLGAAQHPMHADEFGGITPGEPDPADVAAKQRALDSLTKQLTNLQNASQVFSETDNLAPEQKLLTDSKKDLAKDTVAQGVAEDDLTIASRALTDTRAQAALDQQQRNADATAAQDAENLGLNQKQANEKLQTKINLLEADSNNNPLNQAANDLAIAALRAQQKRLEASFAVKEGNDDPDAIPLLQSEGALELSKGKKQAATVTGRTQTHDFHIDNTELHDAVTQAAERLKGVSPSQTVKAFQKMSLGLDEMQKGSLLIAELASATDQITQTIVQRLSKAEAAIRSLKNNHL